MMFASLHSKATTPSFNDKLNTFASGILTLSYLLSFIAFIVLVTISEIQLTTLNSII